MAQISVGDIVLYEPQDGVFPTGEEVRRGVVEDVVAEEIVVREFENNFTDRITEEQIDCVTTGGCD